MKLFGIDYDATYSDDPELFDEFIRLAKSRGHHVVIVTYRDELQPIDIEGIEVFYTSGKHKAPYMRSIGYEPDIWIDDYPELIGDTRGRND